jgi:hypothetical protein
MKGRDHLGFLDVNWRIVLKLFFKKWGRWEWTGFIWLGIGSMASSYEDGNKV